MSLITKTFACSDKLYYVNFAQWVWSTALPFPGSLWEISGPNGVKVGSILGSRMGTPMFHGSLFGGSMSVQVIVGSALSLPLPDASVHCVVTSPPYWGLRAYGGRN